MIKRATKKFVALILLLPERAEMTRFAQKIIL